LKKSIPIAFYVDILAGQRIWLHFDIFEIGDDPSPACQTADDHVVIQLDGETSNGIRLCGNLTSAPHRTSFVSSSEKLVIRVFSPEGRTGRGFLGKFKAILKSLSETMHMSTSPNSSTSLTSLNYPLSPPLAINLTLDFISPPNYVLTIRVLGNAFHNCHLSAGSYLVIHDPYVGTNGTSWTICDPDSFPTKTSQNEEGQGGDEEERRDDTGDEWGFRRISPPTKVPHQNSVILRSLSSPLQSVSPITFRSTFNRLEMTQVYTAKFQGTRWNAEISTTIGMTKKSIIHLLQHLAVL
jgi:hypothetical protein